MDNKKREHTKRLSIHELVKAEQGSGGLDELQVIHDVYGQKPPKSVATLVADGLKTAYEKVTNRTGTWWFKNREKIPAFEESNIFADYRRIIDYVLYGEFNIDGTNWTTDTIDEYNSCIKARSFYAIPSPPNDLEEKINSVYEFWLLFERVASLHTDERSIAERCFAIFALTGYTRLRIDFGFYGDFREAIEGMDYNSEPVFTNAELALILGKTLDSMNNEILEHKKGKNSRFRFKSVRNFSDKENKDLHQIRHRMFDGNWSTEPYEEVTDYIAPNRTPELPKSLIYHSDVIRFLSTKKTFNFTRFTTDK